MDMLDWLKDVLGDTYNDDVDKKVAAEIGKGFISRSDFNAKNEEAKALKAQLDGSVTKADYDKAISELTTTHETALSEKTLELETASKAHLLETKSLREKFSSEAARRQYVADMQKANLEIKDGQIVGYDDFKATYAKNDPNAFDNTNHTTTGMEHKIPPTAESADPFLKGAIAGAKLKE